MAPQMDPSVLFGEHTKHAQRWCTAYELNPGHCPGKDTIDVLCKCPDLVYSTKVRIYTGESIESRIYCGCCTQPIP